MTVKNVTKSTKELHNDKPNTPHNTPPTTDSHDLLRTLAKGLSHDLNNYLGPLFALPDVMLLSLPQDSPHYQDVLEIKQSAERISKLAHQLVLLSEKKFDLAPLLIGKQLRIFLNDEDILKIFKDNTHIQLTSSITDECSFINGSIPHLYIILMSFIKNAIDAMPDGGTLEIETYHETLPEPNAEGGHQECYVLKIADTGTGFQNTDLSRLFEPYYTKHMQGRKSGCGFDLTVADKLVKGHHGWIRTDNHSPQGSVFRIYFPICKNGKNT